MKFSDYIASCVEESSLEAVVLRCNCGTPDNHYGTACPTPIYVQLGTISYYHKNPLLRLYYKIVRRLFPNAQVWSSK